MLWTAVQPDLFACVRIKFEPELGGDHHLITNWSQCFTHEFFVCEGAVNFGGVEERYATFDGRSNQRGHLCFVCGRAIAKTHSHTAQSNSGDFQVAFSKFALLHCSSFGLSPVVPVIHCAAALNSSRGWRDGEKSSLLTLHRFAYSAKVLARSSEAWAKPRLLSTLRLGPDHSCA